MKTMEEYDWNTYTQVYSNQVANEQKDQQFLIKNAKAVGKTIEWGGDQIHPNITHVLNRIAELAPASVFECGYGPGHNLLCVKTLWPGMKIGGVELLPSQVEWGRHHFNIPKEFYTQNELFFDDFAVAGMGEGLKDQWEFVFTNAVIMHLNTEKAVNFIQNTMAMNPKYIVWMEGGENNHNWKELYDLSKLLETYRFMDNCGEVKEFIRRDL